jgi:anthranilate/para-aminobenzoate synthase component I
MAFNICIRTLLQIGDLYEYGVGGGIVWDSIAEEEWDEAQQKSKILNSLIKV